MFEFLSQAGALCRGLRFALSTMLLLPALAVADHLPPPTSVVLPGSFQSELGCPGDWQPECTNTALAYDGGDDVWQATFEIPAGTFEYKAALNGTWDVNYGAGGIQNGPNLVLNLAAPTSVKFYYDHDSHWVTDNVNSIIATVPGSFQSEMGCPGDWQPDCLRSWLQDPDGDGTYTFTTDQIPAGNYEAKVAINEGWDLNYGEGGVPNGPNIPFVVPADATMQFVWDSASKVLTIGPLAPAAYAIIHYYRADGDYGDHTTGDFNDFWGLHLWGDGIDPSEVTEWTQPKPFLGETGYGRFAWVKLAPGGGTVNFIVHRGDIKDGTNADRSFDSNVTPEIWLKQDDGNDYASQARAQGYATVRYYRSDGDYGDPTSGDFNDFWGLHLWGDAIDPTEATDWTAPKPPTGIDGDGAFWDVLLQDPAQSFNFIIHRGDTKDPGPDQGFVPDESATVWVESGDVTLYTQRSAAKGLVTLHYHRPDGDYGDPTSSDFNDFWGLHIWTGAASPTEWTNPLRPAYFDLFGAVFEVALVDGATELAYILHRGDTKDPGPDLFLNLVTTGHEVWQLQNADPASPYILPVADASAGNPGDLRRQEAFWVDERTIAWDVADATGNTYTLHYSPDGSLNATDSGITGGSVIELAPGELSDAVKAKFPHLAGLPALEIPAGSLAIVPEILRGQFAVSAVTDGGVSVDATGLQIHGVLDDLFTYDGDLGPVYDGATPSLHLWAPTAQSVSVLLFADSDPATTGAGYPMIRDPGTGVWSINGSEGWTNQFYLFEVEVFVPATGNVETNLVTDPYSLSLSMNSARSQIVDLSAPALKPSSWDSYAKPPLAAPEDISIYELHVRDFSYNDASVPEALKGTFKAFTLPASNGRLHLGALAASGLTHVHLLPAFDIATVNEDRSQWQAPDPAELATYAPDSDQQQAMVSATADLDGFNWGYDPYHYTAPEGSYATDPDGSLRVREFREMVKALNETGLRVVMDVVYNHTNSAGQNDKSVLDKVVPGYYHRLNDQGDVETSSCCPNTASEYNMMEKLMIDSIVTWAREYKVDGFRFDLMGHHSKANLLNVRAALDALTLADDGVDGSAIYLYGEGWNFGEVANNARFVQATQANMAGTGIGTFNDRIRDGVRGGGPFSGLQDQGFGTGLCYDPNAVFQPDPCPELQNRTDWIRVSLTGGLADYLLEASSGAEVPGSAIDYQGQGAGYTDDPQEIINYVAAHDNETLFDAVQLKVPVSTAMSDRVRAHNVSLSVVALGQGPAFFHAGTDLLRSKSMDRDSYNSGDWFNRMDFTYQDNNWGVGLPVAEKNQDNWPIMQPLLANPALDAAPGNIMAAADHLQEMLQIRRSSRLFRLPTGTEVMNRLAFHNTGPGQLPGLVVMSLADDEGAFDPAVETIVVLFNANDEPVDFDLPGVGLGRPFELHPVQAASSDPIVQTSTYDPATATFGVPGRTTSVFIATRAPGEQIDLIIDQVEDLADAGALNGGQANSLIRKLENAQDSLDRGRVNVAINQLNAFINEVMSLVADGVLDPEEGQPLIDAARNVINDLGG
jgi:pullulanase-type alpha-1,6-glucosidase